MRLSDTVTKYSSELYYVDITKFTLYNLDGTVYKTLYLPPKPYPSSFIFSIYYISTSLFDNDPNSIEYLVSYGCDSSSGYFYKQIQVIREDGSVLLNEPKAEINPYSYGIDFESIYNTEEGTKLKLYYFFANGVKNGTKVFSLPGKIPSNVTENQNGSGLNSFIYPNPNDGSFFIKLSGNHQVVSTIDLLSPDGKLLDTFKSSDSNIKVNYPALINGMYFLHIKTEKTGNINKMIIQK